MLTPKAKAYLEASPGTHQWFVAWRDLKDERANDMRLQELQQQDVLPDEGRDSNAPESQIGCNNVVMPPRAPSTDGEDTSD